MALAVAVAIAGLVVTVGLVAWIVLRNTRRSSDDVLRFDGSVRSVSCRLDAGNVTITGRDRKGAVVRRMVRHGWRTPVTTEALRDDELVVEANAPTGALAGWWWIDYEIELPRPGAVTVVVAAGRVTVVGVDGGVDVRTGAGKVHVRDAGGPLRLHATAGSVEGEQLGPGPVDAHTDAGHVRLSFDAAPEAVAVVAVAGAIELRLPGGPYRVDVESAAGGTRVDVPTAPDAPRTVRARSDAGSVRIVARPRGPADVALAPERLDGSDGSALVGALLADLYDRYGEDDPDAPDADQLAPPEGLFLVARAGGRAIGCGGIRQVGRHEGEVKRMYVVADARRLGIGAQILAALESEARRRGYDRLRLETGVRQPEAIALYERAGYVRVENFPPYVDAPMSVCYAKVLRDV
jgi:GNAT superfamily N-acetyltransferase